MRRLSRIVVLTLLFAVAHAGLVVGVQTPAERIAAYVLIYYVDDPNEASPRYRPQRLDFGDLVAGRETADFWLDKDIPGLQDLVRALVGASADRDTLRFQQMVSDLLEVRGERIAVYLVDDAGQQLTKGGSVAIERYHVSVDSSGTAIWPSAKDDRAMGLSGEVLAGSFATGEVRLISLEDARSTFLHELTHIQALSDARPHLFNIAGKDYSYGLDGSHSGRELIPDLSTVYDEAVAGAMQMLYEPGSMKEAMRALEIDGDLLVEKALAARSPGAEVLDDIWLYDQIKASGPKEFKTTDPNFAAFRVGDLPGRFLLHNETAMALVLAQSARLTTGYRGLLRAVHRTNGVVEQETGSRSQRSSRLTVCEVAHLLPALGREILSGSDPTVALSSGGPREHLLPLALLDYMTFRESSSAEEFGDLFQGQLPADWLSTYWQIGRPLLDAALPAASRAPRRLDAFETIAEAFAEAASEGD